MTPIKQYITHDILLDDTVMARNTRTSAARYVMLQDDIYRTMVDWPLLKYTSSGKYM